MILKSDKRLLMKRPLWKGLELEQEAEEHEFLKEIVL